MSDRDKPHPLERSIYLQAAELESPDERVAFLDQACEGDDHLRERVERLLNFSEAESFAVAFQNRDPLLDDDATLPVTGGRTMPAPSPVAEDNYLIGPELARGGMGSIRQAEDRKLKRSVAVKIMHSHVGSDPSSQARFVREAEVLALLSHPNIVPVYDIVWENGKPLFYTMKLVKGRTLQQIVNELREKNPETLTEYPLDHLLGIFLKVCDAIAFAHSRQIIHRDLKPENVMVGEFGEVLVMDWGIAKILGNDESAQGGDPIDPGAAELGATLEGSVMGTPQYMSPEQAAGEIAEMDARSDIYSLGAILYAILTLRPPIEGGNVHEVLEKVQSGDLTPITSYQTASRAGATKESSKIQEARKIQPLPHVAGGRIPLGLSSVAMKALSLRKESRYQDAAALGADIEKFQGGFATDAERAGLGKQLMLLLKRNKGIFSTAAAAWLLITGLAVWFVIGLQKKERRAVDGEAKAKAAQSIAEQEKEAARQALAKSSINLAQAGFREGNGKAMRAALDAVPEDLRDQTWRYLLKASDTSIAHVRTDTTDLQGIAAHPLLPGVFAVADANGKVTILEVRTGRRLLEFTPEFERPGSPLRVAFSADGGTIAVGQLRGSGVVIHSAGDGKFLRGWKSTKGSGRLELSPDGKLLIQGDSGQIHVWDTTNGNRVWTYPEEPGGALYAIFTLDGQQIVTVEDKAKLRLLDAHDGSLVRVLPRNPWTLRMLTKNADGTVTGAGDFGAVFRFDLRDDRVLVDFRTNVERIEQVAVTPDGRRIVTVVPRSDGGQEIRLWNASNGTEVQSIIGGNGLIEGICVHPLSGELVVSGADTRVWSLVGAEEKWTLRDDHKTRIAFMGSDDLIFNSDYANGYGLLKLQPGGNRTSLWKAPPKYDLGTISSDGRIAAIGRYNAITPTLILRNPGPDVEEVASLERDYAVHILRMSPEGDRLAVATNIDTVELIDPMTGRDLAEIERTGMVQFNDLGWLDNGHLLGLATAKTARGNRDSEEWIVKWNVATGKVLHSAPNGSPMDALAISPDGSRFAEAGADARVRIRDASTFAVLSEFLAHDGPITVLAWHPSKPILATGSADLSVRLWNVETGERLEEFREALERPDSLSFSPSGQRLGCSYIDRVRRIWEPESLKP